MEPETLAGIICGGAIFIGLIFGILAIVAVLGGGWDDKD